MSNFWRSPSVFFAWPEMTQFNGGYHLLTDPKFFRDFSLREFFCFYCLKYFLISCLQSSQRRIARCDYFKGFVGLCGFNGKKWSYQIKELFCLFRSIYHKVMDILLSKTTCTTDPSSDNTVAKSFHNPVERFFVSVGDYDSNIVVVTNHVSLNMALSINHSCDISSEGVMAPMYHILYIQYVEKLSRRLVA